MCHRSQRAVSGIDYEHNRVVFLDTQCGCYSCPQCADAITRLHQARIIYGTKEYDEWKNCKWSFVTLTSHENVRGFDQSLSLFQKAFSKWHKRMKRRYGDFSYVMVLEQHKDATLHAHVLMNMPVSKKWVRKHSRACGLGYMADVQRLHSPAAAGKYISKYISKSLASSLFPKRVKRVRYSHDWPEWPLQRESAIREWTAVNKISLALHIEEAQKQGLAVCVDRFLKELIVQYPLGTSV